jgi:hypothetical protein
MYRTWDWWLHALIYSLLCMHAELPDTWTDAELAAYAREAFAKLQCLTDKAAKLRHLSEACVLVDAMGGGGSVVMLGLMDKHRAITASGVVDGGEFNLLPCTPLVIMTRCISPTYCL